MNRLLARLLGLGLLWFAAASASLAETRYIHDRVEVGVFENAELTGDTVAIVTTGTPLEVLERTDERAKVLIPSGGVGWIDASYLTADEPAAVVLLEFEAENHRLAQELDETRRQLRDLLAQTPPPGSEPDAVLARDPDRLLTARIERAVAILRGEEGDIRAPMRPALTSLADLPLWAAAAGGAVLLVLGLLSGHWWGRRARASMRGGIRVQVHR